MLRKEKMKKGGREWGKEDVPGWEGTQASIRNWIDSNRPSHNALGRTLLIIQHLMNGRK